MSLSFMFLRFSLGTLLDNIMTLSSRWIAHIRIYVIANWKSGTQTAFFFFLNVMWYKLNMLSLTWYLNMLCLFFCFLKIKQCFDYNNNTPFPVQRPEVQEVQIREQVLLGYWHVGIFPFILYPWLCFGVAIM